MPNWLYIFVNGVYLVGAALWLGGGVVIIAGVNPSLFDSLTKHDATAASASILRRFARIQVVALLMMLIGAAVKFAVWERVELVPWMAVRWTAIVLLAWALVFELRHHRTLQALGSNLTPALPADDPLRKVFDFLRIRAEGLMKASLIAALIALLFS
ncbi:MAG: hypothetical protein QOK37_4359 [Thermoanaerobaculia bacterium]|nr:hypothetical protein [Thermoanaerobaculia bacterium]